MSGARRVPASSVRPEIGFRNLLLTTTALVAAVSLGSKEASAQLTGLSVQGGQAALTNPSATSTLITQTTSKAILNWQSFSIAGGTSVQFKQPGPGSIALNRVLGGNVSNIAGQLSANGQVWIVNPSGVFFGGGAQVNVGGLLATTADIQNSDFMAGNYKFGTPSSNPNAAIINQGHIQVASGGSVVLAGAHVSNEGLIQADLGTVVLGGAKTFAIDFQGDKLLSFQVTAPVDQAPANADGTPVSALVSNSGTISASGGTVILTARAAKNVIDNVINSSGIIQATSASVVNGEIVLDGGTVGAVTVTGSLDASGKGAGETGGTIKVLGDQVTLGSTAALDASGDAGGGTVLVGGNFHGAGPEQNATSTTIAAGSVINADAITTGNGGQVAIWSEQSTGFYGAISANGGSVSGNGGMVETSSRNSLDVGGTVIASAAHGTAGTWLLDPVNITVVAGNGALEQDDGTTTTSGGTQTINATGDDDSDDDRLTIGADRISNELSGGTNVILKSAGNIFVSPSVSITDTFAGSSGVSLTLSANPSSGGITFGNNVSVSATSGAGPLFVSLLGGSSIVLGSGDAITTRGGSVSFNKQVVLGTSSTSTGTVGIDTSRIAGAAGAINFASTIDDATGAAIALALNGGAVSFGGSVGATTALTALQITGTTTLGGSTYRTTGAESFTGPVTLLTDTTLTSNNGSISFVGTGSTINGAHALSLNAATGTVSLGGSVGNTAELTSLAVDPVSIILGGSTYHTSGGQTYLEAVSLAANAALTSDSGSIVFKKTIDGAQSLTATAGQTVEVDGLIGSGAALAALSLGGSAVILNGIDHGGSAGVSGAVNVAGTSAITLNEGTYHSGAAQAYTGPVALTADTTMTSDSGDLDFVGTQSTINGAHSLSLQATAGTVSLGGSVGNATELTSLLVDPVGIILGGAAYHTTGDQTYSQAVTLGANTVLTSDNGNINFLSTIDGATSGGQSLTATAASGAIAVDHPIGGSIALAALSLAGNAVTLNGIGGEGAGVTGAVGVAASNGIALNEGTYHSGAGQTYTGAVTLLADTAVTSDTGGVILTSTIDGAHGLSVLAGQGITVGGLIGNTAALTSLTLAGQSVVLSGINHSGETDSAGVTGAVLVSGAGGITLDEGTYHSGGSQLYAGPVLLGADTTFLSDTGGITVTGAFAGAHSLTIIDGGADSFASINLGNVGTLDLTGKTAGSFTANGLVTAASLVTGVNAYALNLLGGATIGDPTLSNTGGITLAGIFLFTDGFTTGQTITLSGGTEINTQTSGITLGTVNQGAFEFIVIADTFAFNGPWNGTGPRGITPFSNLSIGVGDAPGQWTLNQQTLDLLADPPLLVMVGGGAQIAQELNAVLTGQAPFIPANLPGPITTGNFTFNAPLILEGSSINLNGTITQTLPNTGIGFITPGTISGPGSLNLGSNTGILVVAAGGANLTGTVNGIGGAGAAGNTTLLLQLGPGPFIINGVCFAGPACNTGLHLTPQFEAVIADLLNNGNGNTSTAPEQPAGGAGGSEGGLGGISPAAGGDTGTDASFDALTQPLNAKTASQATPKVQGYYVSLLGNLLYEWRQLARLGRGTNVPEENNDFSSWGNEARW
jgi:filamentous hemagglutinin family protein